MTYESARAAFSLEIPDSFNFGFDVIDVRADTDGERTAFLAVERSGEVATPVSYDTLRRRSNRFANVLRAAGVGKGEFALVMIQRIPAWFEVMIACMKTGVIAMPGTNLLTPKDMAYRINKAQATTVVLSAGHMDKVDEIRDACPSLAHLVVVGGERDGWIAYDPACARTDDTLDRSDGPDLRADDLMIAYFTSGTTANPKMVPRDHAYAAAHTITGKYWMDLNADDIHWTLSDTGWAKAAWGLLFGPWMMGATIVLYDGEAKFDPDLHLKLIGKLGVTTFCAPPTVYRVFAQLDLSGYDFGSLRHSLGAGEPLNPEVIRIWNKATGTIVHDGYGQTETVNLVANYPFMEVRPGSMGKPTPGLDVDIVDDRGNVVADGEVGHIAVQLSDSHPPGLFHGYYEDADTLDTSSFRKGWYYTGDTATRDADGYIWFVGRSDDIITSASYRISPFEVESALQEHPTIAESAVVAKPDALRGSIVKAYVVLVPGKEPSDDLKADIQEFVKRQTAPYKYPREIEFRESLPKTISGKIRRVELRAEAESVSGAE